MAELEIEAVAVARVVQLSLYPRQNLQPALRNPCVPSHDVAAELRAQEPVRVDLADDPCQIAKISRWTVRRSPGSGFTPCTGTSAARRRLRQRREFVLAGTGSLRGGEVVKALEESTVTCRSNFERRAGDIEGPQSAFRLLLSLMTLLTYRTALMPIGAAGTSGSTDGSSRRWTRLILVCGLGKNCCRVSTPAIGPSTTSASCTTN